MVGENTYEKIRQIRQLAEQGNLSMQEEFATVADIVQKPLAPPTGPQEEWAPAESSETLPIF